jgi:cyclopropane fatty-acyl-phospholipid synthase-like methyltransferase
MIHHSMRKFFFSLMYHFQKPRWDTNQTPPEVIEQFKQLPKYGHALDLGCGTGTNCIYMARLGWQVTGIDFIKKPIRTARKKAKQAGVAENTHFIHGDVTQLDQYQIPPSQFALDMGCLHGLSPQGRLDYAAGLNKILEPGAVYMILAFQPAESRGQNIGLSIEEIRTLFGNHFCILKYEDDPKPQLWYWLKKKPCAV